MGGRKFDEVFSASVVGRWETDLSKRRNMIAHNKMICKEMYLDTLKSIEFFNKEFEKADELLKKRIRSDELKEIHCLQINDEIAMNLEYCDIDSSLLEEQDIIERLNETDDFMYLSGIVNDSIACMSDRIDEVLGYLKDVSNYLDEEAFFEDGKLERGDLLLKYIELSKSHCLYETWKSLFNQGVSVDVYRLIEQGIAETLINITERLKSIKESIYYIDLECFSEGDLVRLKDFEGNTITLNLEGWFCPERGTVNEVYVNWYENAKRCSYGGIYISYGYYEMTEDDIPIPYVEDELVVNFKEINNKLEAVVNSIFDELEQLENQLIEFEI